MNQAIHTVRNKFLMELNLLFIVKGFYGLNGNLLQDILNITDRLVLHVTRIFCPGLYLIW